MKQLLFLVSLLFSSYAVAELPKDFDANSLVDHSKDMESKLDKFVKKTKGKNIADMLKRGAISLEEPKPVIISTSPKQTSLAANIHRIRHATLTEVSDEKILKVTKFMHEKLYPYMVLTKGIQFTQETLIRDVRQFGFRQGLVLPALIGMDNAIMMGDFRSTEMFAGVISEINPRMSELLHDELDIDNDTGIDELNEKYKEVGTLADMESVFNNPEEYSLLERNSIEDIVNSGDMSGLRRVFGNVSRGRFKDSYHDNMTDAEKTAEIMNGPLFRGDRGSSIGKCGSGCAFGAFKGAMAAAATKNPYLIATGIVLGGAYGCASSCGESSDERMTREMNEKMNEKSDYEVEIENIKENDTTVADMQAGMEERANEERIRREEEESVSRENAEEERLNKAAQDKRDREDKERDEKDRQKKKDEEEKERKDKEEERKREDEERRREREYARSMESDKTYSYNYTPSAPGTAWGTPLPPEMQEDNKTMNPAIVMMLVIRAMRLEYGKNTTPVMDDTLKIGGTVSSEVGTSGMNEEESEEMKALGKKRKDLKRQLNRAVSAPLINYKEEIQ
jgi:hypothetical protein